MNLFVNCDKFDPPLLLTSNEDEQTPVYMATWWAKVEVGNLFVNRVVKLLTPNRHGQTPAYVEAEWGKVEEVCLFDNRDELTPVQLLTTEKDKEIFFMLQQIGLQ